MITIIFGPPRAGKTALMVKLLNDVAFDFERNRLMQKVIECKNIENGWKLKAPIHCTSANFEIVFKKEGYNPRNARVIDPNRLGFYTGNNNPHFILPYETFGIMEAQGYYNSRNFANFPEWKSNLFEQHGHNHLNFIMDTQRPGLIDVNIRELSDFIEIRSFEEKTDKYGFFSRLEWVVRTFDNAGLVDEYMKGGKRDASLYTEKKIISERDIRLQYNSWALEPKFYVGHENKQFDIETSMQYLFDIKQGA